MSHLPTENVAGAAATPPEAQGSPSLWARRIRPVLASRPFCIAAGLLLASAILWNGIIKAVGLALIKERVELVRSLEDLPTQFGPFRLANAGQVAGVPEGKRKLEENEEESLGTRTYIDWYFVDTRDARNSTTPQRQRTGPVIVRLHVAYYTGLRDPIPHVPEVCSVAGGMAIVPQTADQERRTWRLPANSDPWRDVAIHRILVEDTDSGTRQAVFYVFNVNGRPIDGRLAVRSALANPFLKHCYYAKIELAALARPALSPELAEQVCQEFLAAASPAILATMVSAQDVDRMEEE